MLSRRAQLVCALLFTMCMTWGSASAFASVMPWQLEGSSDAGTATSLSCWSTTGCMTTGIGLTPSYVNGQVQLVRSGGLGGVLIQSLACQNGRCLAVGTSLSGSFAARRWNGQKWGKVRHFGPKTGNSLNGVACPSESRCFAVGGLQPKSKGCASLMSGQQSTIAISGCAPTLPVIFRWRGHRRRLVKHLPLPGAAQRLAAKGRLTGELDAVTCISTRSCEAVGSWSRAGTVITHLFAEHWDGRSWSAHRILGPISGPATLGSVSCEGPQLCLAVGSRQFGRGALAVRDDGGRWSKLTPITPPQVKSMALNSVACAAALGCEIVGGEVLAHHLLRPLSELWDAGQWTVQQVPVPIVTRISFLDGVTCLSATFCQAVGSYMHRHGIDVDTGWFLEGYPA